MNKVTDAGRGAYLYLDSEQEAGRMLRDRFSESMLVAARDVRIAVTLPPYFGIAQFSGETFNVDPTKVRPQHLAPDDSMVLYQLLHPCDPSLVNGNDKIGVHISWQDAKSGAPRQLSKTATLNELAAEPANLEKAAAIVGYASVARRLAAPGKVGLAEAIALARAAAERADPPHADPELNEIREMLDLAATY